MRTEASNYVAAFQRVGAVYEESLILLNEYADCENWNRVKEKVLRENVLRKGSSVWVENILRTVKNRFFVNSELLPSIKEISEFVSADIPKSSKIQALYQYVCESDPLVDRLMIELIGPLVARYGTCRLTKQMYNEFMKKVAIDHPEINSWSSIVYGTWQRKFFAFLRHSGVMEKAPGLKIKKPLVRVEPFTSFLYGLIDKQIFGLEVIRSRLWKRYFMSEDDVELTISAAQERGWVEYHRMGSIVELTTRFDSLEDWLHGALEC